jgi:hypothetical protein
VERDLTKPELITGFLYLSPRSLFKGYNQFAALLVGFLGIIFLLWISFYLISYVTGISRSFDPVMREVGLDSERYMLFGRSYNGKIKGRKVSVHFIPSTGLRPALFNIYIESNSETNFTISIDTPLMVGKDYQEVEGFGTEFGNIKVYSPDLDKAINYLENKDIRNLIISLMENQSIYGLREIYIQHDQLWLRSHPRNINKGIIKNWLKDTVNLASEIENN